MLEAVFRALAMGLTETEVFFKLPTSLIYVSIIALFEAISGF